MFHSLVYFHIDLSFKIYWMFYSYVQSSSTMFDVLKFIHHIKMLSELNTLTLFILDTYTIWFVIWIFCKQWEYLRYLLSNFLQINIKTTETTVLKNKNKDINISPQN